MASAATSSTSNLTDAASETVGGAIDGLAKGAEAQKNAGADAIADLARAVRDSASTLETQSPQIARAVRSSADAAERFSRDLKNKDVSELLDATTQFARRQPYMFLGLGVLAGVLLARAFSTPR